MKKYEKGQRALKKWNWMPLVMSLFLYAVILYINFAYYAGVIGMGVFTAVSFLIIYSSIYALLKKERRRRIIIVNSGTIVLIIILFMIATPNYTYQEAKQIAASDYLDQENIDAVDLPLLEQKTVPTINQYSWLLNKQLYYVGIEDRQQDQMIYYIVHPIQGWVKKLDKPYW